MNSPSMKLRSELGVGLLSACAPSPDALFPGTHIDEFVIERVLHTSGYSVVYLAIEPSSKSRLVIKEYLPLALAARASSGAQLQLRAPAHAEAFERGRRAFIEESALLERCSHPSLVRVTRHWVAHGTAYRAMPYYTGQSLLAWRQAMTEPPDEAFLHTLVEGLLSALRVLHGTGRLHGQISPRKILLTPEGDEVLLGFGAARHAIVGEHTQALMTLMDPAFAPIEQTAPAPELLCGPWTDLYALAATLHYCVSGRLPTTRLGWLPEPHAPLAEVVRRLRADVPHLYYSALFVNAVDTALSMQPRDRPQSLAQFRAMLQIPSPAKPAPAAAKPASAPAVAAPRLRHRRSVGWALAACAIAGFATVAWALGNHQTPQPSLLVGTTRASMPPEQPVPYTAPTSADATLAEALNLTLFEAPPAAIAKRTPPTPKPAPDRENVLKNRTAPPGAAASAKLASAAKPLSNPRQVCGERTPFALYRCVQTLCTQAQWTQHDQCQWLRTHDEVPEP